MVKKHLNFVSILIVSISLSGESVNGFVQKPQTHKVFKQTTIKRPKISSAPAVSSVERLSNNVILKYRELDESDNESDPAMLKVKSRTPLGYKMRNALQENKLRRPTTGINKVLIQAISLNQYIILGIATAIAAVIILFTQGFSAFSNLDNLLLWTGSGTGIFDFSVNKEKLLWGILGAMPLLAFSATIENSDKRIFANINFATIVMCMTLFGRRTVPPKEFIPEQFRQQQQQQQYNFPTTNWPSVALQSFRLSTVTGFCEESVFRRLVPAMIVLFTGNENLLIPYIGQALIFGLGHIQPNNKLTENGILFGLQTINGLGFGLIYYLTGGDLVSCIIAHATYDFVTFFKTWKDANDQIEYAETMYSKPLPSDINQQVQKIVQSNPTLKDQRMYNVMKRLFYTFDFDKNEMLSLSEVRKGLTYMTMEKAGTPPPQATIDRLFVEAQNPDNNSNRLSFPEFLRLLSLMYPQKITTTTTKKTTTARKPMLFM